MMGINVVEMRITRWMSCKIRKDRIINEDIRENLTVEPSEDKIERTI